MERANSRWRQKCIPSPTLPPFPNRQEQTFDRLEKKEKKENGNVRAGRIKAGTGSFPVTRFLSTESTSRFRRHVRLSAGSGPDSALSSRESSVRLVRHASCGR